MAYTVMGMRLVGCVLVACSGAALARAQGHREHERVITPARLGLPAGNVRTSEPGTRVYKADGRGVPLRRQPAGYPFTPLPGHVSTPGEVTRTHGGVDISTRPKGSASPKPMDFKAGVYGEVVRAGGGEWNTIGIKLADGTELQYLHASKVYVEKGQLVTPDTVIGRSGSKGANAVHIHVQARDRAGRITDPDTAFRRGITAPNSPDDSNGSKGQGGLGGVLINPRPEAERLERNDADPSVRVRPSAKAKSWRIEVPTPGESDESK